MLVNHKGEKLYTIADLSKASDLPISTIRKWIRKGDLTHFVTVYVDERTNHHYYKIGLPDEDDILIDGSNIYYKLEKGIRKL